MELKISENKGTETAQLLADEVVILTAQDALDIMMNAQYQGAFLLVVDEKHLHPDFFDLKTGLAGEILQKFSTYRMRLIIEGDFSGYTSKSLQDFIFESNKAGLVRFVQRES